MKTPWSELHAAIESILEVRTKHLNDEIARLRKRNEELAKKNHDLRETRIALASKRGQVALSLAIPALVEQYKVTMDTLVEDVPWRDAQIGELLRPVLERECAPGYRPCLYDLEAMTDRDFVVTPGIAFSRLREIRLFIRAARARESGTDE
jgi:hypothetical protein